MRIKKILLKFKKLKIVKVAENIFSASHGEFGGEFGDGRWQLKLATCCCFTFGDETTVGQMTVGKMTFGKNRVWTNDCLTK